MESCSRRLILATVAFLPCISSTSRPGFLGVWIDRRQARVLLLDRVEEVHRRGTT